MASHATLIQSAGQCVHTLCMWAPWCVVIFIGLECDKCNRWILPPTVAGLGLPSLSVCVYTIGCCVGIGQRGDLFVLCHLYVVI